MPRSTHPIDHHRHERAQVRAQRRRYITRRWRKNKVVHPAGVAPAMLTLDMTSAAVQAKLSPETLGQLAALLGQDGPVLCLDPEPLRRAPKELRRTIEKHLGLHVLGANELTRAASVHAHSLRPAPPKALPRHNRPRTKRLWHDEAARELAV